MKDYVGESSLLPSNFHFPSLMYMTIDQLSILVFKKIKDLLCETRQLKYL